MSRIVVQGGHRLTGSIHVHGAKNSALPVLAATIVSGGESVIHNCPKLSDVEASLKILRYLGCRVERTGDTVAVDASTMDRFDVPDSLMREMRSSIVFLGAIAARMRQAKISFPGGCELGPRPIDLHLGALRDMGLIIEENYGCLDCVCEKGLQGRSIVLSFPSVGATENVMIAASLADGVTQITNAAREPEIIDLADYLNACGARITGAGCGLLTIEGVGSLHGCEHTVIPDRIACVTYLAAAAISGGDIELTGVEPVHISATIPAFEEAGCILSIRGDRVRLNAPKRLFSIKPVRTMPYPGFPTDAQAPIMAMTTVARGTSIFTENIFENRYKHVGELLRLGASVKVEGKVAIVEGVSRLSGAPVEATDLRGGAALVLAGLAAEGMTTVHNIHHIDRGYECMEERLRALGAHIERRM